MFVRAKLYAIAAALTAAPALLAPAAAQGPSLAGKNVTMMIGFGPGGGYDRNVTSSAVLRAMIDYSHANPVRRGLVSRPEEWEWSSARWYVGLRPVKIEMDRLVLSELAWE